MSKIDHVKISLDTDGSYVQMDYCNEQGDSLLPKGRYMRIPVNSPFDIMTSGTVSRYVNHTLDLFDLMVVGELTNAFVESYLTHEKGELANVVIDVICKVFDFYEIPYEVSAIAHE